MPKLVAHHQGLVPVHVLAPGGSPAEGDGGRTKKEVVGETGRTWLPIQVRSSGSEEEAHDLYLAALVNKRAERDLAVLEPDHARQLHAGHHRQVLPLLGRGLLHGAVEQDVLPQLHVVAQHQLVEKERGRELVDHLPWKHAHLEHKQLQGVSGPPF